MFKSRSLKILSSSAFLPDRIVTNKEIEKTTNTNSEWIEANLGINERRISDRNVYSSDLAFKASETAIRKASINKEEIDLILVATATPDRKAPSTACLVKHKLDIKRDIPCFDISAVCSGFLYALSIASTFVESNVFRKILIIGVDTFSKITDWKRRDCVFFGDGAGSVIIGKNEKCDSFYVSSIHSNTENVDGFTVFPNEPTFSMNAKSVFEAGSKFLPPLIEKLINENNISLDDIKFMIPHQPSKKLLLNVAKKINFPEEKVRMNMNRYANTSAGTIPILLNEIMEEGSLSNGDLLLFASVGSGWTYAAGIYKWID